jgi:hypothetical protein
MHVDAKAGALYIIYVSSQSLLRCQQQIKVPFSFSSWSLKKVSRDDDVTREVTCDQTFSFVNNILTTLLFIFVFHFLFRSYILVINNCRNYITKTAIACNSE